MSENIKKVDNSFKREAEDEKNKIFKNIINNLCIPREKIEGKIIEELIKNIKEVLKKNLDLIPYSEISKAIFEKVEKEENNGTINNLKENIYYIKEKLKEDLNLKEEDLKLLYKIIEHINLCIYQVILLNSNTEELKKVISPIIEKNIESYDKKIDEYNKSITERFISFIAIFISISFSLSGGISLLSNLFENAHNMSTYKIVFLSLVFVLGINHILWVLLSILSNMINKEIKYRKIIPSIIFIVSIMVVICLFKM